MMEYYSENKLNLLPLIGDMYETSSFRITSTFKNQFPTVQDRYQLVYKYFSDRSDSVIKANFNSYMLEYQRWLYYTQGYDEYWEMSDYGRTDFNYYLLDELEKDY